ncbi:MAG: hypothetical protein GY745_06175 [Actinomycetia bacterium]|nr:hypothetical protein [Actinomycetes bacterium]
MSRLRYAFRTLVGPWCALPVAALEVANLLQRGRPWRGDDIWTTEWLAIVLFIAGPLIAGAAAIDASRMAQRDSVYLVAVSARPRTAFLRSACWTAGPVALIHSLTFVVAMYLGGTLLPTASVHHLLLGFGAQLAAIFWYAAIGSALGRFVPPLLAGLLAAVVALGLFYRFSTGDGFLLLDFGASTNPRLGTLWNEQYLMLQIAALVGTALVLVTIRVYPDRNRNLIRWQGAIAITAVLAITVLVSSTGPAQRTVIAAPSEPDYCIWGEPRMCFFGEHERMIAPTEMAIIELVNAAMASGYESLVPAVIHEEAWHYAVDSKEIQGLWMADPLYRGEPWDKLNLIQELISPGHCPQMTSSPGPNEEFWDTYDAVMLTWGSLVDHPSGDQFHDAPEQEPLTPSEVSQAIEFLDSCDF